MVPSMNQMDPFKQWFCIRYQFILSYNRMWIIIIIIII